MSKIRIPALAAGCGVLLKPSEVTPRFAPVLQKTIAAVPALASVFQVVTGADDTDVALVDNVDMLCFTGSVATGRTLCRVLYPSAPGAGRQGPGH